MAKMYTANEIQDIVTRSYLYGFGDGKNFHNRPPEPPHYSLIVTHPIDKNEPHKRGHIVPGVKAVTLAKYMTRRMESDG